MKTLELHELAVNVIKILIGFSSRIGETIFWHNIYVIVCALDDRLRKLGASRIIKVLGASSLEIAHDIPVLED